MSRNFQDLSKAQWAQKKFLCIGLDPDLEKIPEHIREGGVEETILAFNKAIIEATKDIAGFYKPNAAFYEAHGEQGLGALEQTMEYLREVSPDTPIIYDAKRADIGNTNLGYVRAIFDRIGADAVTVHPYMGGESLTEFFDRHDKGIFVMCRNSNPGAGEFQDLEIGGEPLYIHLAKAFATKWNKKGNGGLVVGATFPDELKKVREIVPTMPILIPGVGAQGGDLEAAVRAAKDANGEGFIVAISRAILYANDGKNFAGAAREKALEYDGAIRNAL